MSAARRLPCDRIAPGNLSAACRSGDGHRCPKQRDAGDWCSCPYHGKPEPSEPAAGPRPSPPTLGEIHGLALDNGQEGIDIAAATDEGKPGIVLWIGGGSEPTFVALAAVPALMSISAEEALKATT